ncbi:MAG: hypothetical protein KAW12_03800 [Candidatus Aminicenantes bacterium]|nr:hypothetical protein [Candidatus Aminicenantes bacterium]
MENKAKKNTKTDPLFDGHLEKDVTKMSPKEKLLYLSRQIQLRRFIETKVRKISTSKKQAVE